MEDQNKKAGARWRNVGCAILVAALASGAALQPAAAFAASPQSTESALPEDFAEAARRFGSRAAFQVLCSDENAQSGKNAVFSPASLYMALAMSAETAGGDTRAELLGALGAGSVEELRKGVPLLWEADRRDEEKSKLLMANSLWLNHRAEYEETALSRLKTDYFADARISDFASPQTPVQIADWVSKNTNGLLGNDPSAFQLEPDDLLVLINTLYFKDQWLHPFSEQNTRPGSFARGDGSVVPVDYMNQIVRHAEIVLAKGYDMASLDFLGGSRMTFILPDAGQSPHELLSEPGRLDEILYGEHTAERHTGEVAFQVPKFKFSAQVELIDTLEALGVKKAFLPDEADFSPICKAPSYIGEIRQEATISVDEAGCEAAAYTLIANTLGGLPMPAGQRFELKLDRPFCFVLEGVGAPLFIGVVGDPSIK